MFARLCFYFGRRGVRMICSAARKAADRGVGSTGQGAMALARSAREPTVGSALPGVGRGDSKVWLLQATEGGF